MENNTKAFNRINSIANPYFESEKELVKRVNAAKTIIKNTLRKFPTELWPEELQWVRSGANTRITGFEFRDYNDKVVEITDEKPLTRHHNVSFYIIGTKGYSGTELTVQRVSIPAYLLFNDPIATAQYARKLIRSTQEQLRYQAARDITKQVEDVSKKITELAKQQEKLKKQREDIRQRNQQARESIEKARAKQEKRRAAKLAKTES
jgi:hypothetical protein